VTSGTATRAQVTGMEIAGKTGTTEAYGDAWFVGWTKNYTIAVWVGYPDGFQPMKTEFQGTPVAGGTYPAGIFKTFAEAILDSEGPDLEEPEPTAPIAPAPGTVPETAPVPAPTAVPPAAGEVAPAPAPEPAPVEPAPAPAEPAPAPAEPVPEAGGEAAPVP
jgi:penicillin-binding protein 1A